MEVLKVKPLTEFDSPVEIINEFGSKEKYLEAIRELEQELYFTA
jgi:type I restriction enzyme R subunit